MRLSKVAALGLTAFSAFANATILGDLTGKEVPSHCHHDEPTSLLSPFQKHQQILAASASPPSSPYHIYHLRHATDDLLRFYEAKIADLEITHDSVETWSKGTVAKQQGVVEDARALVKAVREGVAGATSTKMMVDNKVELGLIQEMLDKVIDQSAAYDKLWLDTAVLINRKVEAAEEPIDVPEFKGCLLSWTGSRRSKDSKDSAGPTTHNGEESFEDQGGLNLQAGPASEAFKKILRLTAEIAAESKGTTFEAELRGVADMFKEQVMLEFAHLDKDAVDRELSAFMRDLMGELDVHKSSEPRGASGAEAPKDDEVSTWKFHDNDAEILDRHPGWGGCVIDFDSDEDVDDRTDLGHEPKITTTDDAARDFATNQLTKEKELQNLAKQEAEYQQQMEQTRRQWTARLKEEKTSSKASSVEEISQAVQEIKEKMASVFEWYDHEFAMVKESISKNIAMLNESLGWSEQEMLEKMKNALAEWVWQDEFDEATDREDDVKQKSRHAP